MLSTGTLCSPPDHYLPDPRPSCWSVLRRKQEREQRKLDGATDRPCAACKKEKFPSFYQYSGPSSETVAYYCSLDCAMTTGWLDKVAVSAHLTRRPRLARNERYCTQCGKHTAKRCVKCKAPYCARECQLRHWGAHKAVCSYAEFDVKEMLDPDENDQVERHTRKMSREVIDAIEKKEQGRREIMGMMMAIPGLNGRTMTIPMHSDADYKSYE